VALYGSEWNAILGILDGGISISEE